MISSLRQIDKYLGNILCSIFGFFCKKKNWQESDRKKIKKILIIRLWTLGESILTLPMVKKVHDYFPNAEIDVLVLAGSPASVFKPFEFINKIYKIDLKNIIWLLKNKSKYDLVIDTEPYFNLSALLAFWLGKISLGFDHGKRAMVYNLSVRYNDEIHAAENYVKMLEAIGIKTSIDKLVPFPLNLKAQEKIEDFLRENNLNSKILIGIHAGTAGTATYRAWPIKNFAELVKEILFLKKDIVFLLNGSSSEMEANEYILEVNNNSERIINIAGLFSLPEVWELYKKMQIFVSNDTGPMHAAAAQKLKTIGIFGPNLPQRFGPFPLSKNLALYHGSNYSPCINVHKGEFKNCPCEGECIKQISVREVKESILGML